MEILKCTSYFVEEKPTQPTPASATQWPGPWPRVFQLLLEPQLAASLPCQFLVYLQVTFSSFRFTFHNVWPRNPYKPKKTPTRQPSTGGDKLHASQTLHNYQPRKKNINFTPRKINIEPENDGLEDDFPTFQG